MNNERLNEMMIFADKLSKGIDPTSNRLFGKDTVMRIDSIKKYNADVYELLEKLIDDEKLKEHKKNLKFSFFMNKEDKEKFPYSTEPISISKLTLEMNKYVLPGMKKLDAKVVSLGLTFMGYLEEACVDKEKKYKKPTSKGKKLGITEILKKNSYGNEYGVNLYNVKAQQYIVNNIESIIKVSEKD